MAAPVLPDAAASTSAASMTLSALTVVPLARAASVSAAQMTVTAKTRVILANASSKSGSTMTVKAKTRIPALSPAASTSASTMTLRFGFLPEVVQTYRLSAIAQGYGVNGLTLAYAGAAFAEQECFDVIAAINLAASGGTFSVCDNAIKQALDDSNMVTRA